MARNISFFLYHPSQDGQRFLVNVKVETAMASTTVVMNWQAGVGR